MTAKTLVPYLVSASLLGLASLATGALAAATPTTAVSAAPQAAAADLTKSQLGLYLTAKEAYQLLQNDPQAILVDVRDPVEIKFTGFAAGTHIHVPYQLTDITGWSDSAQTWPMTVNPNFDQELLARLNALGVAKDANIIIMCRSGATRSAPAVDRLARYGYSKAWSVTDGFEGGTEKTGPSKGVRKVDGWRNSGLPWSYNVPADVAWRGHSDKITTK